MSSIYEKYNLKQVINASGRMTILGVSTPSSDVVDTVKYGLNHYFEMKDLVNKTGAYIAKLLNAENAVVVSCASAGIAQSVAAVIVKDDDWLLENLHAAPLTVPHDIVVPKGHNVNFGAPVGTMVTMGGDAWLKRAMPTNVQPSSFLRRSPRRRPRFFISNPITVCRKVISASNRRLLWHVSMASR